MHQEVEYETPTEQQKEAFLARARTRLAYWQSELDAEDFEEFRPEYRRRVAIETELIRRIEAGQNPWELLKQYRDDTAPNMNPNAPQSRLDKLLEPIREAMQEPQRIIRRVTQELLKLKPAQHTERNALFDERNRANYRLGQLVDEYKKLERAR